MKTTTLSFVLLAITVLPLRAQWNQQTVDNSQDVGRYSDIAYDNEGNAHIVYADVTRDDLKYAVWTGNGWEIYAVETGGGSEIYPSIAVDSDNGVHMCFYYGSDDLVYRYVDPSGYVSMSIVDGNVGSVYSTSICVDYDVIWEAFTPHIIWNEYPAGLRYAKLNHETGNWEQTSIDESAQAGRDDCDIITNGSGEFFVSYLDLEDYDIRFGYFDGQTWSTFFVDGLETNIRYGTSIALDGSGIPHISYYDQTNGDLKYATINPTRTSASETLRSLRNETPVYKSDNR